MAVRDFVVGGDDALPFDRRRQFKNWALKNFRPRANMMLQGGLWMRTPRPSANIQQINSRFMSRHGGFQRMEGDLGTRVWHAYGELLFPEGGRSLPLRRNIWVSEPLWICVSGGYILNVCLNAIHSGSANADPAKWLVTQGILERGRGLSSHEKSQSQVETPNHPRLTWKSRLPVDWVWGRCWAVQTRDRVQRVAAARCSEGRCARF